MPEFINILIDALVIPAKNENFKIEKVFAINSLVFISLQIILLFYITTGDTSCIQNDDDFNNEDDNLFILLNHEFHSNYINSICSSAIKWNSFIMYVDRIILLSIILIYMYAHSYNLSKLNRYDSIRTNQKFENYIGDKPVEVKKNYFKSLKYTLYQLLTLKFLLILFLLLYILVSILLSIFTDNYTNIFLLHSIKCNTDSTWNFHISHHHYFCHFDSAYIIFILWIITNIIFILYIFINILTITNLLYVIKKFDKLFPDIDHSNVDSDLSINYINKSTN